MISTASRELMSDKYSKSGLTITGTSYLGGMEIEILRQTCLALPAVTEDIKWGSNLVFSVGGKMFLMANLEPPYSYSFKVKDEEFEELCNRDGFLPAPYLARAKWVLVTKTGSLHKQEWVHFIRQSYELVKARLTKKERLELGL